MFIHGHFMNIRVFTPKELKDIKRAEALGPSPFHTRVIASIQIFFD